MEKKISQLPELTSLDSTVYLPVVQGTGDNADNFKVSLSTLSIQNSNNNVKNLVQLRSYKKIGKNKFDKNDLDIIKGHNLDAAGNLVANGAYGVSGYILIEQGQNLYQNSYASGTYTGYYDGNFNLIYTSQGQSIPYVTNSKYIRTSYSLASTSEYQIELGTSSTTYEPYCEIGDNSVPTTSIVDGAVTTSKISDNSITNYKLSDDSVSNSKLMNDSVTNIKIADDSITSTKILDDAVINSKIRDNSITTSKIYDGSVTNDKIADNTITNAKISDNTITSAKIADNSITNTKISDNSITSTKISDSSITNAKLGKGSVTGSKLAKNIIERDNTTFFVTGKNKFNINASDVLLGYYINYSNGVPTAISSFNSTGYIPISGSTTYTYSSDGQAAYFDSNYNYISGLNNINGTHTSPANARYVRCSVVNDSSWTSYQVEVGSAKTSFEPYSAKLLGSEIKNDTLSGAALINSTVDENKATFFESGKNKFNVNASDILYGTMIDYRTGIPNPNSSFNTSGYIPVSGSTTYSFSDDGAGAFYDSNFNFISGISDVYGAHISPTNAAYLRFSGVHDSAWTYYQVEVGNTPTFYEPYELFLKDKFFQSKYIPLVNDIAMPNKLYMLSSTQNDIFIEPIIKRWRPDLYSVVFSGYLTFQRKLNRVASISLPSDNSLITTTLLKNDNFSIINTKDSRIVLGTKSTGTTEVDVAIIGDNLVSDAFFKDALLDKVYCPNIKMIGVRKIQGETNQHAEGRGGWSLKDFMKVSSDFTNFNPFWQPNSNYKYWNSTGFWINAWKVYRGTAGNGVEPTYSTIGYEEYLYMFDENTGYKLNPTTNDIMYESTNAQYKIWNGSSWVNTDNSSYTWSFNYSKYLSMWGLSAPKMLFFMVGLNDFINSSDPEKIDFTTWNSQIDTIRASYASAVSGGKFVLLIPPSTCGIVDNDSGADTIKQNAAMWMLRKNIIDKYDGRDAENIYVVDIGITVDNYYGFNFSNDSNQTLPYAGYTGTETIKVQTGNPFPTPNYPTMGIPLAAFIQKFRQ